MRGAYSILSILLLVLVVLEWRKVGAERGRMLHHVAGRRCEGHKIDRHIILKNGRTLSSSNKPVLYHPLPTRDDPSEWFTPATRMYRECVQWDKRGKRFLTSVFDGGMGAVMPPPAAHHRRHTHAAEAQVFEEVLVPSAPRPALSNLGFHIDYPRNRVVSCASDKHMLSLSTIVAYDYTTWETLFVVELQAGADNPSLADDLTFDPEGNIYVTDTKNGKIWKVKYDGSEFSVFCNDPLFQLPPVNQYYGWVKVNGILYHNKGFLLVSHLAASALLKVSMDGKTVRRVGGLTRELLGDGIVLLDDNTMVIAGLDAGVHIVATCDNWETAVETHHSPAPSNKVLPTSVSLKKGRPFVGYVNLDLNTFNTIAQPVFTRLN